jgi:large conductance mechanosensitive channel
MSDLVKGFKEFILRGDVIDLAIAVVIGSAFTAVVTALVENIVTPLIGAIVGKPSFGDLSFTINSSHFGYGNVINAIITFVSVAAVIYFLVVAPMNTLAARRKRGAEEEEDPARACPECLSSIPKKATRCSFCTSQVTPVV